MQNFKIFLFGFSFSALIWGIASIFLEHKPTNFIYTKKDYNFYNINLTNLFFRNSFYSTNLLRLNITLKAIFKGKKSFIIIQDKSKTLFLNLNQSYKGYKLIKIFPQKAIFHKNGKNYIISFKKIKNIKTHNFKIDKNTFKEYKNNLNKIWHNIGIIKINDGYLITYIKKNSIFQKIGLKKGDILLEVNGRKLKNDSDAWDLYQNADNFKYFEIKLKRNNKLKVINYEID